MGGWVGGLIGWMKWVGWWVGGWTYLDVVVQGRGGVGEAAAAWVGGERGRSGRGRRRDCKGGRCHKEEEEEEEEAWVKLLSSSGSCVHGLCLCRGQLNVPTSPVSAASARTDPCGCVGGWVGGVGWV